MNIKSILTHNFDISKTVVVSGKGPTSSLAVDQTEGKYVAVTTSVCDIFPRCDFVVSNDAEFLETNSLDNIDNLIVPIIIHRNVGGRAGVHDRLPKSEHYFYDILKDKGDFGVFTYRLFTQNMSSFKNESTIEGGDDVLLPYLLSGYHTALHWLCLVGFRNFEIYGISKNGGYNNETINQKVPKQLRSRAFFEQNYQMGIDILTKNNCNYIIN